MSWDPTQDDLDTSRDFLAEYAEWLKEHEPYATEDINTLERAYFCLPSSVEDIFLEEG